MATIIEVNLPVSDATQSIEVASVTPTSLADDMTIKDAFKNKNNSMTIVVTATTAGTLTIKAGNAYPNSMLGDLKVACAVGTTVILLQDISRFETSDGKVNLANTTTVGTIFVTAKRAGILPASLQ